VQDLLLAQQRDRPAYCFQHLDLEYDSADDGGRVGVAPATRACPPTPVARFEPEWNSPGVNKNAFLQHIRGDIWGQSQAWERAFCLIHPAERIPDVILHMRQ